MKQSIGNIWITTLVITFMLIFVGYMTFMLGYSDSEITKNDVLSIIEKRNGITSQNPKCDYKSIFDSNKEVCNDYGTIESINLYLAGRMYHVKGYCSAEGDNWYGVKTLDISKRGNDLYEKVKSGMKYYYCFSKQEYQSSESLNIKSAFYGVIVFYQLDLPILPAMPIQLEGKTMSVARPSNCEIAEVRSSGVLSKCPSSSKSRMKS